MFHKAMTAAIAVVLLSATAGCYQNQQVKTADEIAAALRLVGWRKVQRTPGRIFLPEPGMALDFGGFGKEYAVDFVAQLALEHGLACALVDFGHDLRAMGTPLGRPAWHIGLEDPADLIADLSAGLDRLRSADGK